eukprot:Skav226489  [mRNA]  locus=scaffold744:166924:168144:+ [translate_table: standard]
MAVELEKETFGMASAGGSDDPEDKKDKMPTLHPSEGEEEGDDVDEMDEGSDTETESSDDDELVEAISKMTLKEKKEMKDEMTKQKDKYEAKEKLLKDSIKKHEKAIRNAKKAEKSKAEKDEKKEKEREEREQMITVNVQHNGQNFAVVIRANRGIGHLRELFFDMARVKGKDKKAFVFHFGTLNLFESYPSGRKTLRELGIGDGSVVQASVRGVGGARLGLMKGHLKTADDAKKELKSKVKNTFSIEKTDEQVVFPESFTTFLTETRQSVEEVKLLQSRITFPVIELALKQVHLDKLNLLVNTLEYADGKRKGTSEEKLSKALGLVFPKLTMLSHCVKAIEALNSDLTIELFNIYIDTYGHYVNGAMIYNNSRFLSDVKKEILKREIANNQGGNDEVNTPAGCLIV